MDNKNNRSSIGGSTGIMLGVLAVVGLIGSFLWLPSYMPVIFPPQASAEAKSIDGLFQILLIIGGIVFFLIQGLLVISVIAFRKPANDDTDGVANHGNMTIEIVWTIIPAIVVTFLAIMSFNVWQDNTEPKANINMVDGDSITLNVAGARYAWTHTYVTNELDDDGEPYVLNTGTDLHVYVGQNVLLTLQTQDVLHSYWVPAMRVKQDLLPGDPNNGGRPTELRFTVAELNEEDERIFYNAEGKAVFPIVCAELCGDGHSRMRGDVIVHESLDAYVEDFYVPTLDAVINPPPDPVLRGQAAIQTYACSGCHILNDADAGIAWSGPTGPPLDGIADRAGGRVSGQSAEEYLVTSIWNSGAYLAPGYQNLMPAFGPDIPGSEMTGEQLYSIVAYLCTQGEESTCDNENNMTVIPEAIFNVFGVEVDGTFGLDAGDASAESTAEPDAEATDEPEAEATAEADD
jgi:cytochrome c oxidase subunit II